MFFQNFEKFEKMCQSLACQSLAKDCILYITSTQRLTTDLLVLYKITTDCLDDKILW